MQDKKENTKEYKNIQKDNLQALFKGKDMRNEFIRDINYEKIL